jgi:hypothetical protein
LIFDIPFHILMTLILASLRILLISNHSFKFLVRIIFFVTDAHNFRGILGSVADVLLFNIPIILWMSTGFLIVLYWYGG